MRRIRSTKLGRTLLKPANAVALVALLLATTGTATAAKLVSGTQFKRASLTAADLKSNTLLPADFSTTARKSMSGRVGPQGDTGDKGDQGALGIKGPRGAAGKPANVTSTWAWFDSRYLRSGADNVGGVDWSAYSGSSPNGNHVAPNLQWTNGLDRSFETVLSLTSPNCNNGEIQGTDCPWGANDGGGVTVAWDSNITAVAELTIMHSQDADLAVEGTPVHTRASCYLSANRGTGSSQFDQIGARVDVSGFRQRQVETITLVGSINRDTSASTDYMVRVECRDADGTNNRTRYYVVSGSMSVVATERGD